jgi:hypothetical protein
MARLVHPQPFHVRPFKDPALLSRHLLRIEQGRKLDVLRFRGRLQSVNDLAERNAQPRDDHRPAFHAAHTVDPLDRGKRLQQLVQVVEGRSLHLTRDLDLPRLRAQRTGIPGWIVLAGPELVIVIVAGDILPGCQLLVLRAAWQQVAQGQQASQRCRTESRSGDEVAPIPEEVLVGDL